ncbi:MAG: hypothetical protein KAV82_06665 [Phycisphaerae bacterium]|nr:hypothetical protein [Phycisphaerae bacterium]
MCNLLYGHLKVFGLLALVGFALAPPAWADVLQTDADIKAEVREFVADKEVAFDSAFEEYKTTSPTLPLGVVARLLPPPGISTNGFIANAIVDFRDPAVSPGLNPREFGLETTAYSREPDTCFSTYAVANETRRVVFSPDELGLLRDETKRPALSGVFVSGAVVVWSEDPTGDLDGLSAGLMVKVEQKFPDAEPQVVFKASLTVTGASDGQVRLISPDGIFAVEGGPEVLKAAAGFTGDQLLEELAGLGHIHLVIIPEQELPYLYDAPAGVEFELKAVVEVEAVNVSGGTGVAAVFGRPFEQFARAVGRALRSEDKGIATQEAVNAAMADAQAPSRAEPASPPAATSPASPCGAAGSGMLAMTLALILSAAGVRRVTT